MIAVEIIDKQPYVLCLYNGVEYRIEFHVIDLYMETYKLQFTEAVYKYLDWIVTYH